MITKAEYYSSWMPWRLVEMVLPAGDKRNYEAWARQGFAPVKAGAVSSVAGKRGKARLYSLSSCIGLATLWELTRIGYKPSACIPIVNYMVKLAQDSILQNEQSMYNEDPVLVFYEMNKGVSGDLRGMTADRQLISEWIARPDSKEARPLAKAIEELTNTSNGAVSGFFYFEGGYVIRRILERYEQMKRDTGND